MLIYPTLSSKDGYEEQPYGTLLKIFETELHRLDVCVIIGFSFRDKHVKRILEDAAKRTKFIIISPSAELVFKKYFLEQDLSEEEIPGGTETIVLVEDEDMVRNFARQVLIESGYTVLDAGYGEKAFEMCEAHEGKIHLLITDVVMPQMSGREVSERLQSSYPEMKVLYMSGYTDDIIDQHAVLDKEIAFIHKPFLPDDLLRKVREVLDAQ